MVGEHYFKPCKELKSSLNQMLYMQFLCVLFYTKCDYIYCSHFLHVYVIMLKFYVVTMVTLVTGGVETVDKSCQRW